MNVLMFTAHQATSLHLKKELKMSRKKILVKIISPKSVSFSDFGALCTLHHCGKSDKRKTFLVRNTYHHPPSHLGMCLASLKKDSNTLKEEAS